MKHNVIPRKKRREGHDKPWVLV